MEDRYRWYRTEIPNLLDDAHLSPSAYRLYGHIKRVAGDNGQCRDSSRQMAEKCRMSLGMVSEARKELLDAGFINVAGRGPHGLDILEITDIWPKNYEKYSQRSHYERCDDDSSVHMANTEPDSVHMANTEPDSVHMANTEPDSVHIMNTEDDSVHIMNANDRTRSHYEHNKKEQTTNNKLLTSTDVEVDPPPKPKPKRKPPNETYAALKAAFVEVFGTDKFNHAQVGQGIKLLESAGCTPEELKGCYLWIKSDTWWEFKTVYPQVIFKQMPEYRRFMERKINTNGAQNGNHQSTDTDPSFDLYARFT